jgi:prepilin signal peptidase PulO-like enzyme (type II secretory pathway)
VNPKLQTRLGSAASWSVWTIAWILALRLFIALVSDPNRTQNYSPLWFVLWLITTVQTVLIIWLVLKLGLRKRLNRKPSILANMTLGAVVGGTANVTTGVLAIALGLDSEGLWEVRALGGALSFPLMLILLNNLRGAMIERNDNIAKLREIEDQLLGYRESAKQILQDALESMRNATVAAVTPALDRVSELLKHQVSTEMRRDLIDELRNVIATQVRPLSQALHQVAEKLSIPPSRTVTSPDIKPKLPSTFGLRKSLTLMPAFLLILMGYPMVAYLVIDRTSLFRGVLSAIGAALVMSLLKLMLPKTKEIKTWLGLTLLVLFASIAAVPGFLITYFRYGPIAEIFNNAIWMVGISVGAFLLTSYARAIDEAREKYERELEQFNEQLSKEVALFEQRLWLERRAWSYVIHGDVQGSLSAAVTRLQRSEKLEPYELEMVKQDMARATKALTSSPAKDINFTQSLDELVRTWAGVCNIKIESSARADRAIDANLDVRNCINEICKEAISNAVRHGNAKNAVIRLSREKDDVIELEICNDGHKPLREQPNGMGLSMIDDLSLSWQLTTERHKNQTCLVAQLPIGNKS